MLIDCSPKEQNGWATFATELATPQPVRVVSEAELNGRVLKKALGEMWDYEQEEFRAVAALLSALQKKDRFAITRAREHVAHAYSLKRDGDKKLGIVPVQEDNVDFGRLLIQVFGLEPGEEKKAIERWNGYRGGPMGEKNHKWLLSQLVSQALGAVRLVLWWSGEELRPAVYCPKLKDALYAFLLLRVARGRGLEVCPHCGEFFIQRRSDQNYCTISHREAHRVARWRAARAIRVSKKGGPHGARKAR